MEELPSAGELEDFCLYVSLLGAGIVLNCEQPEVSVFTEQIPPWQYLLSYRLMWHYKFSKLTNILFCGTSDVTQNAGNWLTTVHLYFVVSQTNARLTYQ